MKTPYVLFGLLALTASVGAGAAENKVYKWKDANGVTHFSETPPPKGTEYDNVRVKGEATITTSDAAAPKTEEQVKAEDAAKAQQTAKSDDQSRCAIAQDRLAKLQGQAALTMKGSDGKTIEVTPERRASELKVAQAEVGAYCAAPKN